MSKIDERKAPELSRIAITKDTHAALKSAKKRLHIGSNDDFILYAINKFGSSAVAISDNVSVELQAAAALAKVYKVDQVIIDTEIVRILKEFHGRIPNLKNTEEER